MSDNFFEATLPVCNCFCCTIINRGIATAQCHSIKCRPVLNDVEV
jgi:hypothetical protein